MSDTDPRTLSDADWQQKLDRDAYLVLRHAATERPWTGALLSVKEPGTFVCAGCDQPLFDSTTKYESGCGWPSFFDRIAPDAVELHQDLTHGMVRVEVRCSRCGGHLGHVFEDGPRPTGLRYCMNSVAMRFVPTGS